MPHPPPGIRRWFRSAIVARGMPYVRSGAVRLTCAQPLRIEAEVTGTEPYEVRLVRGEESVEFYCGCPFFDREFEPCKHLWATLVVAANRIDLAPWGRAALDWIPEGDLGWNDDEADFDEEEIESPESETRTARTKREDWRLALSELRTREEPRSPGTNLDWQGSEGELLYVLEEPSRRVTSALILSCEVRRRGSDGEWKEPRALAIAHRDLSRVESVVDRELLLLLAGATTAVSWGSESGYATGWAREHELVGPRFELQSRHLGALGERLAATGRLRLRYRDAGGARLLGPPIIHHAEAWSARLLVTTGEGGSSIPESYLAAPEVRNGEGIRVSASGFLAVPGVAAIGRDFIAPLDDAGLAPWFERSSPLEIAASEIDDWLEALHELPRRPPLALPPELALETRAESPRPRVELGKPERIGWRNERARVPVRLSFRYGGVVAPASDPRELFYEREGRRAWTRDLASEAAAWRRATELGATPPPRDRIRAGDLELLPQRVSEAVRTLVAEGWEVVAEGARVRAPGRVSLAVATGIDWFELDGQVDFGGPSAAIAALLAARKAGETTVELGDGSRGLLPEEWLSRHALLLEMGEVTGEQLRFRRAQAPVLDGWFDDGEELRVDAKFRAVRRAFASFDGVRPAAPPRSFRGELRDYQREGLGWLLALEKLGLGGCLADDMGLGKTVQLLALLAGRAARRGKGEPRASLVVVPRSLLFNWRSEAARFAPRLELVEHHGNDRARNPETLLAFDVVLTTYGTLRSDVELLAKMEWDYCVLDESQAIKNEKSAAAKAAKRIRARHRLTATGTPVENHLGELWSQLDFANPGALGRSSLFRQVNGSPRQIPEGDRRRLARALRPYVLRRTKAAVAPELPAKTEQTLVCGLEGRQRALYDELRRHFRASLAARAARQGWARTKIHVLEALLRLRQAACHPALVDPVASGVASAKFDALLPRLEELRAEGQKALVFSQFTSLLALLRMELDARKLPYESLDGSTVDRESPVRRFQSDPDCPLFLVSLKAGGSGLNLTAAEYVFLLDPWWNPAVEAQAIDRTHRIGQTKSVFAYRLIAKDTVEERILELQAQKRELAEALFGGEGATLADLRREDLELLLS